MNDLDKLTVLAASLAPRLTPAARRLAEQQSGYPAGTGSGGSGTGDRTGTLAVRNLDEPPVTDTSYRDALKHLQALDDIVRRVLPSTKALDHLATQASDARPHGCCESCFRDGGHRTSARTTGSRMCKWCQNLAATLAQEMPPLMLVQRHNRGQRITDRDIRTATGGKS